MESAFLPKKTKPVIADIGPSNNTATSAIKAQKGDLVPLEEPEFDVVNDGGSLRVSEIVKTQSVYSRAQILERKAKLEKEIENIDIVLKQMDNLGVQ